MLVVVYQGYGVACGNVSVMPPSKTLVTGEHKLNSGKPQN